MCGNFNQELLLFPKIWPLWETDLDSCLTSSCLEQLRQQLEWRLLLKSARLALVGNKWFNGAVNWNASAPISQQVIDLWPTFYKIMWQYKLIVKVQRIVHVICNNLSGQNWVYIMCDVYFTFFKRLPIEYVILQQLKNGDVSSIVFDRKI